MGRTKKEYIAQAFEELGLAGYIYDLTPEQLQSALSRLDAMMATWNARGVRVGWAIPIKPMASDIDYQTNTPDAAHEAIYLNLAIRLAPSFGKVVSPELKVLAKEAYTAMLSNVAAPIIGRKYPSTMPLGAGNRTYCNFSTTYSQAYQEKLKAGDDGYIILE